MPPAVSAAATGATAPTRAQPELKLVVGGTDPHRNDAYEIHSSEPIVASLQFIEWESATGETRRVDRASLLGGILLAASASPDKDPQNQMQLLMMLMFLEYEQKTGSASRIVHELTASGAFSKVYRSYTEWEDAIPSILAKIKNPDSLKLKAGDFDRTDWIERLAGTRAGQVAAANAYKCDETLAFLAKVPLGRLLLLGKDSKCPGWFLARMTLLAGQKSRHKLDRARDDSHLRICSEIFSSIIKGRTDNPDGTAVLLGKLAPEALEDLVLPKALRSTKMTPEIALGEMQDAYAYHKGDANSRWAIEARRLTNVGNLYTHLRTFLGLYQNAQDAALDIGRLVTELCPQTKTSTFEVQLECLEVELATRSEQISSIISETAGLTGKALVNTIIASNALTAPGPKTAGGFSGNDTGGGPDGDLGDVLTARPSTLREETLKEAFQESGFIACIDKTKKLSGRQEVEEFMLSGSTIALRAALVGENWLLGRHAGLKGLSTSRTHLSKHFERALTIDVKTDTVPTRLEPLRFPISAIKNIVKGEFDKLPYVNGEGGFLNKTELTQGVKFNPVPDNQVWTVDASVRGARALGRRLFGAINMTPDDCVGGYTFSELCDKQLELIAFANSLPKADRAEWLRFAHKEFVQALKDAGAHFISKLFALDPTSAEAQIDEFLPMECDYFPNVRNKMQRGEPIFELRTIFPSLQVSGTIDLPGVEKNSGGDFDASNNRSDKRDRAGDKKNKGGKDKEKPKVADGGPGSRSSLCKCLDSTHLFIAGFVIDTEAAAKEYGVKMTDKCWPVLLSKKEGTQALTLCPEHVKHGGLNKPCHQRPKGFNLDHVYNKFGRKATTEELAAAGWRDSKKAKV